MRRRAAKPLLCLERTRHTSFPIVAPLNTCGGVPEVVFECVCAQKGQSEMKVGYLKLCSRGSGNPAFIWFLVFPFALPAHWRAIASRAQHRRVENSQTDAHASTWMYAYKDTRPSASKVCMA